MMVILGIQTVRSRSLPYMHFKYDIVLVVVVSNILIIKAREPCRKVTSIGLKQM
jgi:hypothetical protein